ncbi:lipopolysaccharide heptosyltransferase II [Desulfovibrio sp. OttesenSCG-928-O18]|nr:lipopolysaccharide heptosyltransferase II [Desulfovibrio sp. OttesenSCG-928-O18]
MNKIGVWNTAFLGDAILTLPLLQTLRAAYPDAVIDFWVRKGFGGLFRAHPAINTVYEYDKRGKDKGALHAMRLGRSLARERYALWISAHASLRSALVSRLTGAGMRIGYAKPASNALFYTHVVPRRFSELEEIERLQQLLIPQDLAARGVEPAAWPEIVLPGSARDAAEAYWTTLAENGQRPVLGLHPGSIWGTKRWPVEYFAAVAVNAAHEGAHVLVFGGPGEEIMAEDVAAQARKALSPGEAALVVNLAGTLSLTELAAYIGRLDCYVTNDSGPMHLAWPQKTPVTAMFGPTVRELGFFPRGASATVMELPLPCRPCGLHGPQTCPQGHHKCMRDMTPDMVWPDVAAKMFATR